MGAEMRSILAALFVFAAAPAVANDMEWIGYESEGEASLLYGVPESGIVDITMNCRRGSTRVEFTYAFEPPNAKVGMKATVELSAGGQKLQIAAKGDRWEMDDLFVLEGVTELDAKLIAMISAKGNLTVTVGSDRTNYPLAGAKKAAGDVLKTCRK